MSIVKSEDEPKWINAFLVIISLLMGYLMIQLAQQMGEWFDLEAKVQYFLAVSQGVGILIGVSTFIFVRKNLNAYSHLQEVYAELVKVIWPEKDSIVKMTIGLVIGLSIISGIFLLIDLGARKILELIY